MLLINNDFRNPVYSSPDCSGWASVPDAIICQSGTTKDWVEDENWI